MSYSERLQVLVSPPQRRRLERLARDRKSSVGAVIRDAIDNYPLATAGAGADLETMFELDLPVGDWPTIKAEIIDAASG